MLMLILFFVASIFFLILPIPFTFPLYLLVCMFLLIIYVIVKIILSIAWHNTITMIVYNHKINTHKLKGEIENERTHH